MEQEQITFDQLPKAISKLLEKVSKIEMHLLKTSESGEPASLTDQLFTVNQAAEFLSLAVPTVYSMISRNTLPFMKRSKRIYFSRNELMDYLKAGRKNVSDIEVNVESYLIAKKKRG